MLFFLPTMLLGGIVAIEYFLGLLDVTTAWLWWLRGLTLPASWVLWSMALLYHRFEPSTVIVVLLGSTALLATVRLAGRKRGSI